MNRHWKNYSAHLTNNIMSKIDDIPSPGKFLITSIPFMGALFSGAFAYAETHKWAIFRLAKENYYAGKLSKEAANAFVKFERALENEKKAHENFLKAFEKEL